MMINRRQEIRNKKKNLYKTKIYIEGGNERDEPWWHVIEAQQNEILINPKK